jgi:TatD DNase family protein
MALPEIGRPAINQFLRDLPSTRYVGEVGLDFSRSDLGLRRQQVRVFEEILAAPTAKSSLWSIHSRRAEAEVIALLESFGVPAVLHWFSGSKALVERAATGGLYFSVNAAMLASARGRSLIEAMPPNRVLTETDAPYVETSNGRRDAVDVVAVVDALARVWGVPAAEAQQTVFANMTVAFSRTAVALGANDPTAAALVP